MPKKDIFIDNNIAKNFSNPLDPEYKKLIQWLIKYEASIEDKNAYLVVSKKLLAEYNRTIGHSISNTNIVAIIGLLTRQGRLKQITNQQIKEFRREFFTKKVEKNLKSNQEDRDHIPTVLLSDRKYALTLDEKFTEDLLNFPKFIGTVAKKPSDIPYDQ